MPALSNTCKPTSMVDKQTNGYRDLNKGKLFLYFENDKSKVKIEKLTDSDLIWLMIDYDDSIRYHVKNING